MTPLRPERRIRLQDIAACFEGIIPSSICTCSLDGVPNITFLSIVQRLDEDHVALSVQFFNKTARNVAENPRVMVAVVDPQSCDDYLLDLEFDYAETAGAAFEAMRLRLEAVASQGGMSEVFRLRGVDVYRVLDCRPRVVGFEVPDKHGREDAVERLSRFASGLTVCKDLEALTTTALAQLEGVFGWAHSFILVRDETGRSLFTIASHGFPTSGVGSEVHIGEGLIGTAAVRREPIRSTNLARDRVMTRAIRQTGREDALQREIPLPGLTDAGSQLVVPLVAHDELIGVLILQSQEPGRFLEADERIMGVAGHHLAASMVMLGFAATASTPAERPARTNVGVAELTGEVMVKYHESDDSIFIDDAYVIRGVAGRLLLKLVRLYLDEGREDFTNKELRVDASLGLPDYQDNLEARLVLLRRRLQERSTALQLARVGRGRMRLEVFKHIRLKVLP